MKTVACFQFARTLKLTGEITNKDPMLDWISFLDKKTVKTVIRISLLFCIKITY